MLVLGTPQYQKSCFNQVTLLYFCTNVVLFFFLYLKFAVKYFDMLQVPGSHISRSGLERRINSRLLPRPS